MGERTEGGVVTEILLLITLVNVGILGLTIKLYTEFAKQRMQETRKP